MKILLVGDLYIPGRGCLEELNRVANLHNATYRTLDWDVADLEELNRRNLNVEASGPSAERPPDELWDLIEDVEILIVHFCPVPRELLDAASRLKVIGTLRTGLSNIDTAAAQEKHIDIVNVPGRLADSVSDYTIGLMIAETRNIARSAEAARRGRWRKQFSNTAFCFELAGKTVGLIGIGDIGKKVASKLRGFDVKTIAYDPYVSFERLDGLGIELVDLGSLLSESDIVSIHASLNESTRGLVGREEIALMKPTSYLINTARAAIIDKDALYDALSAGWIAGAALDVFWDEPVDPSDAFLSLDNVTITSHLAGSTQDALSKSIIRLNKRLQPHYEKLSRQ